MFGKKKAKQSADRDLFVSLAPVVGGTVTKDGRLRGSYGGRAVDVRFEVISTMPIMYADSHAYANLPHIECLRLRMVADGGVPWYVRSEPTLNPLSDEHRYEFISEAGQHAVGRLSPFADMIAVPDPAVEARLQEAGLFEAITALAPPSGAWVPRVRFTPDPRAAIKAMMTERLAAAGALDKLPDAARQDGDRDAQVGLMIDLPRDMVDPTPEGFAKALDAIVAIIEMNERVNPPR